MLQELRQIRYGYYLGIHILLLCAAGKTPTEIGEFLFCSRSSVYRTLRAYGKGEFLRGWPDSATVRGSQTPPRGSWQARLVRLLSTRPRLFGWCRTRWSCAALALQLQVEQRGLISRETIRRQLHELGYAYKRAKLKARDDDPERIQNLARIRHLIETLPATAAVFFADELDIHLLSKLGYEWMKKGRQREIATPGQNQKQYLVGAWDYLSGKVISVVSDKKDRYLFLQLLESLHRKYPAQKFERLWVVVDNDRIHKAKAVTEWLKSQPRFELVFLPTYCPQANPIERIFGDVHDQCTRNHQRQRLSDLVSDVVWYLKRRSVWHYALSKIYDDEQVTAAIDQMNKELNLLAA